jgi:hypothetical protein
MICAPPQRMKAPEIPISLRHTKTQRHDEHLHPVK